MPWTEICVMDERTRFIAACVLREESVASLCRQFGIRRKTAYTWLGRYRTDGVVGLVDRSRAHFILSRIEATHRRGPYPVSVLKPATAGQQRFEPLLFQDLSAVLPHLITNWHEVFLNQAAQEPFWHANTRKRWRPGPARGSRRRHRTDQLDPLARYSIDQKRPVALT